MAPTPDNQTGAGPAPQRIGIREIAREVGVSIMTVSLALRNNPKISEATRRKVRTAAERLGYKPDPEIARLMTLLHQRRQVVDSPPMAIVDLSPTRLPPDSENYCELVRRGAVARAESLGYIATCFHQLDYNGDLQRLLNVIHFRGIRGILLLPPTQPVVLPENLDWSRFSVLAASYAITPLIFNRVVPHQFIDMCRLLRILESKGFSRIGSIFESNFEERIHFHFTAALKLLNHGDNILRVNSARSLKPDDLSAWLRHCRPDAIVTTHAPEVEAALPRGKGFPEPQVVSLRAVRGSGLSYWDERPEEIGSDAALLLAGMVQHNETGIPASPRTSMVHGQYHEGTNPPAIAKPESAIRKRTVVRKARKRAAD